MLDKFVVPARVDKSVVVDNLLAETAEFEILYTDPGFLRFAIGRWSEKELPIWEKLLETTEYEYNPIHNYDRIEDGYDNRVPDLKYGKGTTDASSTNGRDTTLGEQRAFNDTGLVSVDKQTFDHGSGVTTTHTGTDTETGNERTDHHMRVSGNIGVMSTQNMIEQERSVVKFNIIDVIISDFKSRFCLMVY